MELGLLIFLVSCSYEQPVVDDSSIRMIRVKHVSFEDFSDAPFQGIAPKYFDSVAKQFATSNQLTIDWQFAEQESDLVKALLEDRADIAVGLISKEQDLPDSLQFSTTLSSFEDWIVGFKLNAGFGAVEGSRQEKKIRSLFPDLPLTLFPPSTTPDELADSLIRGEIGATIMPQPVATCFVETNPDSRSNHCSLNYVPKLRRLEVLPTQNFGWVYRAEHIGRNSQLDDYLNEVLVLDPTQEQPRSWQDIQKVGRLRMITRVGPTTYYLWKGQRAGYEYEILKQFATHHNLELDVVIGNRYKQLEDWLMVGKGDVISASYTEFDQPSIQHLAYSNPYMQTHEQVVSTNPPVRSFADLAGRTVLVNPETSYFNTLSALRGSYGFEIEERPLADVEALIDEAVMDPALATVADRRVVASASVDNSLLAPGLSLGAEKNLVWVVRESQQDLLEQLNTWLETNSGTLDFNLLRVKYFQNPTRMRVQKAFRFQGDSLSMYDDIVKDSAEAHGFDWRLITAILYQESQLDPNAISIKGARGLMQVLPETAREFGYSEEDLMDPETNIRAGVEYLAWVRDRFANAKPGERMWFTLAAFNAGIGHVQDARRITRALGDDPDQWFNHVENAILMLSEPRYYNLATYGYCRGEETHNYVREVRDRYRAYADHLAKVNQPS